MNNHVIRRITEKSYRNLLNLIASLLRKWIIESTDKEIEMKLGSIIAMIVVFPASADTVHWDFSESSTGEDVHWLSPTTINPNVDQIEYDYEITYVGVDVWFLGILWHDEVTSEIDPKLLSGTEIVDGPAPIIVLDESYVIDGDSDGNTDVEIDMFVQVNGKGRGQLDITNIFLGDVWVDTGFPFGDELLQIDRIYMDGHIDVTEIDLPCPADIDNDGAVDVTDILITIGNWGGSGEGDVDGDGIVSVSDILLIVGAWGPC